MCILAIIDLAIYSLLLQNKGSAKQLTVQQASQISVVFQGCMVKGTPLSQVRGVSNLWPVKGLQPACRAQMVAAVQQWGKWIGGDRVRSRLVVLGSR